MVENTPVARVSLESKAAASEIDLICAKLCKEVYQDFDRLRFEAVQGMEVLLFESQENSFTDTQVALLYQAGSDAAYLVFRGTDKSIDWINNLQFRQQIYPYGDGNSDVQFHRGFMSAYFAVRDQVLAAVEKAPQPNLIITGHSLGGALATIAALDLQYNITSQREQAIRVRTFGAPRVGNGALAESYNRRVPDTTRFVFGWDIVTRVPRLWQGYRHVGQEVMLGSRWTWQIVSRRFSDHNISNYIAALEEGA